MTDDAKLKAALNSIGKLCFITHYELFRDKSRTDASYVVEFLMKNDKITEAGAKIRVSFARGIFVAGRQNAALMIIAQSKRVPRESIDKALLLLNDSPLPFPSPGPTPPISGPIKR